MDRYQRVEMPQLETPINENEIHITKEKMRNYITYAPTLLQILKVVEHIDDPTLGKRVDELQQTECEMAENNDLGKLDAQLSYLEVQTEIVPTEIP
ncbi:hypothetical protein SUGI_0055530 [Cryptomeria japonica]|nr:hypothetical protein SUGI_0055530 [Cryptomeria japonica]